MKRSLLLSVAVLGFTLPLLASAEAVPLGSTPSPPSFADHVRGRRTADITVIEYADFECPYCVRHQATINQILRKYRGKVNFVYRHYPLSFHTNAKPAALASECVAHLQGTTGFWKFVDLITEKGAERYESIGKEVSKNPEKFKSCMDLNKTAARVERQVADAVKAGISGTPATILYSKKLKAFDAYAGALPLDTFTTAIDSLLAGKKPTPAAIVPEEPVTAPEPEPTPSAAVPAIDPSTDHVRGKADARISIVSYTDFECPFCKRNHETLQQVLKDYPENVNVVYRDFPLSFHANAMKEAVATECAAQLGGNDAYWKFVDGIFEKTTSNGTGFALKDLPVLAEQISLDKTQFTSCMENDDELGIVAESQAGSAAGVDGTPTNFIIDHKTNIVRKIGGAQPLSAFKSVIDTLLAQ